MKKVDWSKELFAVDRRGGERIPVSINREYHCAAGKTPVKMPCNMWTGGRPAGTWLIDNDGFAIGGMSEDGYNGRYTISN